MKIKHVVFIEPYDGGSHRAFRTGWIERSRHKFKSLTLPARFWKWRMRGAAVWFADMLNDQVQEPVDLIFTTGFLNVADLRGMLKPPLNSVPILLYMHENQMTYPLSPDEEFDFHFGFTNIISCLASDRVVFNSDFHRELFLDNLSTYLGKMPEGVPKQVPARLRANSEVLGVGLERHPLSEDHFPQYRGGLCDPDIGPSWPRGERPLLVWNHRWEFDKRPEMFSNAVNRLLDRGLDFEVALLGESKSHEETFQPLADRLGSKCVAFGFLPRREQYDQLLNRADIVVSCANQEYFGISVAEAIQAGCYPVLPREQVYPSLYGTRCKGRHFYDSEDQLVELLADLITGSSCGHVCSLDRDVDPFCWDRLVVSYDALVEQVADQQPFCKGK
ncbi:MAG: DUF3524 domain-containing protein [bacterium]|nr:DUF3524 domain-containing protein [bacterium]